MIYGTSFNYSYSLIADLFQCSAIRKNSNRVEDIRAISRHDSKLSHESKKKEEINIKVRILTAVGQGCEEAES